MVRGIQVGRRRIKDEATIRFEGRLVGGPVTSALGRRMRRALERGVEAVTIDLGAVRAIDCEGIGLLLRLREEAMRRGAEFRVARPSGPIRAMLRLCDLLGLLEGERGSSVAGPGAAGHDAPLVLPA